LDALNEQDPEVPRLNPINEDKAIEGESNYTVKIFGSNLGYNQVGAAEG